MRVAVIQASSVFLDAGATTAKALSLMDEAARNGASLCVFPEVFLSGYPIWLPKIGLFNEAILRTWYRTYVAAGLSADGPELKSICERAEKLGLFAYIGFIERAEVGTTVYCSLAAFHPERGVVGVHRKIKPTRAERMLWHQGDGHGLRVHEFAGFRVGGLNCFENWQPLARQTLYAQGEQIHVTVWPGRPANAADLARFIAQEGGVYVLAASGVLTPEDIPNGFPFKAELMAAGFDVLRGGSMVVAPGGKVIAGPVADVETILYADVEAERVIEEHERLDPAGHYLRSDIFSLRVDGRRLQSIEWLAEDEPSPR